MENILSAARLLQLNAVVNACCDFLQQQLDPSNCLGIAMFAEQQACIPLQVQASEFTLQNFMEVLYNSSYNFCILIFYIQRSRCKFVGL